MRFIMENYTSTRNGSLSRGPNSLWTGTPAPSYKERNGLTYLSYIRNGVRFKCDWKRKLFSTNYTILSEMVVTDGKESGINTIPYKMAFRSNQSLSDKVSNFADEGFWGSYNIIEPTESLEHAVNKLKKQHR